ncbi:beta-lactamase-like protein, partial [Baffinella frigidus]
MSQIKVVPLGAGQDVGKSCILITMGGKNIMLDCGMHPGYNDHRRFPDFRYISSEGNFTGLIDLVIISHFHLDHCGSLPYFTQVMPILLEDYRKISVERRGIEEKDFFTSQQVTPCVLEETVVIALDFQILVKECMMKVTPCVLEETVVIAPDFEIRPYYAGHVLGAAMFYVRVGQQSFLYTGDYNMTPDRHLGSARCDRLRPDLMITESTYATTIRESKRWRERDLLNQVSECVRAGGKVLIPVLIPVFALGRAQELCLLLDAFWERTGLDVPIYFSAGLTEKANWYYKMFISWTNQKIKDTFVKRNVFDFQ